MNKPFDLVIFGGTGDLSMRKLLPAMYRSCKQGNIPEGSRIMVSCRKHEDFDELNNNLKSKLLEFIDPEQFDEQHWQNFENFIDPLLI